MLIHLLGAATLTLSPPPACPSDTTYFIVTNGDNEYDRQYIPRLLAAPPDTDIIALDFYSRYEGTL